MKYNISINQHSVINNESLRNLDLVDLVLFDFVYHFICAEFKDKRTISYNGVQYTQIKHKLVELEMPLLNIGTSRTFINRMNNLIDAGLIKRYPHNQKEGVSYFAKGDNFSIMTFSEPAKNNSEPTKNDSHPTKEDAKSCENDFAPPTKNDSHNNIYNNNIDIIDNKKDNDKSLSKESDNAIDLVEQKQQALKQKEEKFEKFWNIYDKKVGKAKAKALFLKLSSKDIESMAKSIMLYVSSKPDKQYRPDPERFIRNRVWEDEIISTTVGTVAKSALKHRITHSDGTFSEDGYRYYLSRDGKRVSIKPTAPDRPNDGQNWDYNLYHNEWYINE